MVSVTHSVNLDASDSSLTLLTEGLNEREHHLVAQAFELAGDIYQDQTLGTGESVWLHAQGMGLMAASLKLDADSRIAALLFALGKFREETDEFVSSRFGEGPATLVRGLQKLADLRIATRRNRVVSAPELKIQKEILRKMFLALVEDIRVVLLRLASRTQTLRYLGDCPGNAREDIAHESLDIYAPLANRLGVWQLKWELEDLSFRYLEPETYRRIAKMLDERRLERETFIRDSVDTLKKELEGLGITCEVYGRPKHIYSIYNKMCSKHLDFSQLYDIRALRVLVEDVKDCYTALGVVHQIWQPITHEFDDYISKPKGNNYRSLHTAVLAGDGRALEVQIRTFDMHRHAELGVAAHWRYKEGAGHGGAYDEKIALLRSLLSWREEVADAAHWLEQVKQVALDDTIYVLTPQGKVFDMPRGATPVDFAYRLHTTLGHHCRGAKVDGHLVPLNTPLESGQTVEIVSVKEGGPSRDWLDPKQNYVATSRARSKIKQYFSAQAEEELLARGRSFVNRELQREGRTQANIENLANRLGFKNADALYLAAGRGEVGPRSVQTALREGKPAAENKPVGPEVLIGRRRSGSNSDKVLIVGVGKLLTTLSRCCKPAPPDAIQGFVTRGRGVSIHRVDCPDFQNLVKNHPERVIAADWGEQAGHDQGVFPVDIVVQASDRQGLLRDISDVLSREKLNVISVNTLSKKGTAVMRFTLEVTGVDQIKRATNLIGEISGVTDAQRK